MRVTPVALLLTVMASQAPGEKLKYPAAPRGDVVDRYHGIAVADPYRWLEDPDTPEARRWITEENVLTESYLASAGDLTPLKKRLGELSSPVVYPWTAGRVVAVKAGRSFFVRRDAGQNQPVLYWMASKTGEPKTLLDPNTLSADGTAALMSWAVSDDGKRLVYGIARSGSDWQDVRFRDVDSAKDLEDKLEWVKFVWPAWAPDGSGVYYGRFPQPAANELLTSANYNQKLLFHKIGTPQSEDKLIYERPDHKDWGFGAKVSDDGRYLIISVSEGTRPENLIYFKDLSKPDSKVEELISKFSAHYSFLGSRASRLFFQTTAEAPRGRVITIDLAKQNQVEEIVPQGADVLDKASLSGDSLFLVYQHDVSSVVREAGLDGRLKREVALPGKGEVAWAELRKPEGEQFFTFESFTQPTMLCRMDSRTGEVKPFQNAKLPFDPAAFETRQVFFPSKDGTRIPMFLVGRKGFQPDPNTPVLLYGYGGFDVSITPQYKPLYLAWIERGGVFASVNLRGGGEYGREWHEAGIKQRKQNVFDDFIAAAEWLIANKYTSKQKLGIYGRSNGGLLIGAVLNQRPDLFGAAIPGVGVMDMLRFHKFTIGHAWTSDYGSPDNPEDFKAIRAYSPLQNIRTGVQYPPVMVLTSDHDDRVVPAHSFKYAAALQHAQEGSAPILIRIETSAGHGGGKPVSKQIDEAAAIVAFLEKALEVKAPKGS